MKKTKLKEISTSQKALELSKELGQKAADTESLPQAQSELEEKLPAMKRGPIKKVWDKVLFLWDKFKSPEVPLRLKVTIVGALLYLILPADVLPDVIPGIGLVDDLSVILIVFREVSKYVLPKIEKKIEQKIYNTCYEKIDEKLSLIFKTTLLNTLWTFLANVLGCAILVIKPFGTPYSRYVAYVVFGLTAAWAIFRIIRYLVQYGTTTKKIAAAIWHRRSISKGLSDFVKEEYIYINYIYAGIEIAKSFVPEMPEIPDLPQIIKTFEKHYKKRVLLFVILLALYTALIWLTKFLLLR